MANADLLKAWFGSILEMARRFPAATLWGLANSLFACWASESSGLAARTPLAYLYASGVGIFLSMFAGLAVERFGGVDLSRPSSESAPRPVTVHRSVQAVILAATWALAWFFCGFDVCELHFGCSYFLTLAACAALTALALGWSQGAERVFPCVVFAGVIGCAAAVSVGIGFTVIECAIDALFDTHAHLCEKFWCIAFASVFPLFSLAYATRRETFEFPKVWRVLVVRVTLPVYFVLLAILLAYFIKCVATWSLPNGQINLLVIISASVWMFLHLLLGGLDGASVRAFRRFGAFALVPLLALQVCALHIRISAYGLTPDRYASVLFVIYALAFAVLSQVRRRWSVPAAYVFLAALAVFAAHSHWNVIDVSVRSQLHRLDAFRARLAAGEKFDEKTRAEVMDVWDFTDDYVLTCGVYRHIESAANEAERFKGEWGFDYLEHWNRRDAKGDTVTESFDFNVVESEVDLADYASCRFGRLSSENGKVWLNFGRQHYGSAPTDRKDVTGEVRSAVLALNSDADSLSVDLPGYGRIVMTSGGATVRRKEGNPPEFNYIYGECLILLRKK